MTEAAASALLNPTAPITPPDPGHTPAAGAALPATPEVAQTRLDAIKADPTWLAAFGRGDVKTMSEHAELLRIIYSGADQSTQEAARVALEREKFIDHARNTADIPEPVADMIRADTPVSAHERRMAEQERDRLIADPEFRKAWLAGGRAEKTRFALVNAVLARPLKTATT